MSTKTSIYVGLIFWVLYTVVITEVSVYSNISLESSVVPNNRENRSPKSSAEGDLVWNYTWGDEYNDYGFGIWADETHLYTVGGSAGEDYLLCWEKNGTLLWNSSFDDATGVELGTDIWGDNNYIYTVGTLVKDYYPYSNQYDIRVIKWNKEGIPIWSRSWGDHAWNEEGFGIWGDNTSIYTVGTQDARGLYENLVLIRWSKDGTELWNSSWGDEYEDFAEGYDLWGDETAIYTIGSIELRNNDKIDLVIHKWDKEFGYEIWEQTWHNSEINSQGLGIWGDTTNLYVTGDMWGYETAGSATYARYYICIINWDKDGNQIYNMTYKSKKYAEYVERIWGNSAYLYTIGYRKPYTYLYYHPNDYNISLVQWNKQTGTPRLNCTWGGEADDWGSGIWGEGNDIYTIGMTESYGLGYKDLCFLKWDFTVPVEKRKISGYSGTVVILTSLLCFIAITSIMYPKKTCKIILRM